MDRIDQAFLAVKREDFLPEDVQGSFQIDAPLPIGFGQTNSQPSTVRMMLNWLDPQLGDKVLDVGSGSGWTTALLSHLSGPAGKVYAVEKVPELVVFGEDNCRQAGVKNVRFFPAGEVVGLTEYAPYDRILVSAAAEKLPAELIEQLKPGGRLVIPIGYNIHVIDKIGPDGYETTEYPGFTFVPLF